MVGAMRSLMVVPVMVACGSPASPQAPVAAAAPAVAAQPWAIPAGFKSETIPFPLDFAPGVVHEGAEELRFSPGFFDPAAPGYWSYAFVWRTRDAATMDAAAVGGELTAYFRGLIDAVDSQHAITDRDAIAVRAREDHGRLALTAHVFDAFKTHQPLDLVGWAARVPCSHGAVWRFVLAPAGSGLRPQLDALAAGALCDQPVPPPRA